MKISQFILSIPLSDGTMVLKQVLTGSIIALDEHDSRNLLNSEFDKFNSDEINFLFEQEFIYDDNVDEAKLLLKTYQDTWHKSKDLVLHIMPTHNCQLDCPYCYEDGICRTINMGEHIEKQLFVWLESYLVDKKIENLRVIWFGGEPLLRSKQIGAMMPKIAEIANRTDVRLETQIVTNGVLLTKKVLKALSNYNLNRLQITLDGPPEIHDKRRYFKKDGAGTFSEIYSNIRAALEGNFIDKIDLRINIDRENYQVIDKLFDKLVEDGIRDRIKLSIGLITGTIPNEDCGNGANAYFEKVGLTEDEAINAYLQVIKLARDYGFETPTQMTNGPWCIARHPHAWMIGPEGEIYRCLSLVGRDEGIMGHLPEVPSNEANEIETLTRMQRCLDKKCPIAPICGGGCLFENHIHGDVCPIKLLTEINQGLIRLQYE